MKIEFLFTDEAILKEVGRRLQRYRLNCRMTQEELAEESGVSKRTVERIEAGKTAQTSNLVRILLKLKLHVNLEVLVPEPQLRPMDMIKAYENIYKRKRATGKRKVKEKPIVPWTWGDER